MVINKHVFEIMKDFFVNHKKCKKDINIFDFKDYIENFDELEMYHFSDIEGCIFFKKEGKI